MNRGEQNSYSWFIPQILQVWLIANQTCFRIRFRFFSLAFQLFLFRESSLFWLIDEISNLLRSHRKQLCAKPEHSPIMCLTGDRKQVFFSAQINSQSIGTQRRRIFEKI